MALLAAITELSRSLYAETSQNPKKQQQLSNEKHAEQKAVKWHFANTNDDCDTHCAGLGGDQRCSEQAIRRVNSASKVKAIAKEAGRPCDDRFTPLQGPFPLAHAGHCMFTPPNNPYNCGTKSGQYSRYCPCSTAQAFGDPHLTNMKGDFFDINREGISTFLKLIPQDKNDSDLRIDALIEHPGDGSMCFGFFIRRLWIKGSLVGEDIEMSTNGTNLLEKNALTIKVGNTVMQNSTELAAYLHRQPLKYTMTFDDERNNMHAQYLNNRVKFATLKVNVKDAEFVIGWSTGANKPNILEIHANNLAQLGTNWGGLLASDDHTWVSTFDPACRKSNDYKVTAQLLSANNRLQSWSSGASF